VFPFEERPNRSHQLVTALTFDQQSKKPWFN